MRVTNWVLGVVLGMFIGGFVLEAGMIALLLVVPALVWAARERGRPAGLGGLLVGVGVGQLGLLALAQARCVNTTAGGIHSFCTAPDLTPYILESSAFVALGLAVTISVLVRRSHAA